MRNYNQNIFSIHHQMIVELLLFYLHSDMWSILTTKYHLLFRILGPEFLVLGVNFHLEAHQIWRFLMKIELRILRMYPFVVPPAVTEKSSKQLIRVQSGPRNRWVSRSKSYVWLVNNGNRYKFLGFLSCSVAILSSVPLMSAFCASSNSLE